MSTWYLAVPMSEWTKMSSDLMFAGEDLAFVQYAQDAVRREGRKLKYNLTAGAGPPRYRRVQAGQHIAKEMQMLQLTITDIDAMQWFKPQKQGTRLFVDSLYFGHFKEPTRRDFLAVGLAHTQWQAVFHDGELSVATAPMWCSPAPPANANGPAWTFYHVIHGHEWTDLATPPGVGDHWRNPENFRSTFITEYMLKNTMNGFRGMKEKNPVVDNIGDLHWGSDGAIFFRSMVDAVLMCTLAKPGEGPVQILQVTVPAADMKSTEDCFLGEFTVHWLEEQMSPVRYWHVYPNDGDDWTGERSLGFVLAKSCQAAVSKASLTVVLGQKAYTVQQMMADAELDRPLGKPYYGTRSEHKIITDMRESLAKLEKKEMEVSAQAHKVDPEAVETPSPLSKKPRTGDV
eukprot:s665_g14.t1